MNFDSFVATFASSTRIPTKLACIKVRVLFKEQHATFTATTNVLHIIAEVFNNLLHLAIVVQHTVVRWAHRLPYLNNLIEIILLHVIIRPDTQ